jgi:hypothetical protein
MTLVIAPCNVKAARYAVEHWHYSQRMPAPPLVHYGAWEDDRYIGAVIFGRGASDSLLKPYGLDAVQGAELVRVALRAHHAPVSQIVTACVKRLKASSPGLRLLVSYADPAHGHHGGIYQAMGWTYAGTSAPDKAYIDASGRRHHSRTVSPTGWKIQFGVRKRVPRTVDCTVVNLPGKHRYLLPLDRPMRRQIAPLARPYPQARGRGVEGDAPAVPAGEAGSTPADRSTLEGVTG